MIESLLVADRGVVAARVIAAAQALGIKCVGVGLTHPEPLAPGNADVAGPAGDVDTARLADEVDVARLADDVVLLSDLGELHDPVAVVRAAQAAGVEAIHPGRGPLRFSGELAQLSRAADIVAVLTLGIGAADPGRELARAGLAVDLDSGGTVADGTTVSYFVLVSEAGIDVLHPVGEDAEVLITPAPWATDSDEALARAAAAILGRSGLLTITVRRSVVVGVDYGLRGDFALVQLLTGIDLLDLQIAAAQGSPRRIEPAGGGVAVRRRTGHVVDDVRALPDADRSGLRLEITPLGTRGHRGIVTASAWAADRETAETILRRYDERRQQ